MGIIGVVAALTVPNLNAATGEKEKIAKVKKIYKDLNDAYGRAIAVYGPVDEWFASTDSDATKQATRFGERMLDFMKVSKNCKNSYSGCFNSASVGDSNGAAALKYFFITADGTSVGMLVDNTKFNSGGFANGARIYIDIDGPQKGQNKGGKDLFAFVVDKEGVVPFPCDNPTAMFVTVSSSGNVAATSWIINYDNMDYLKTNSTGKCPNGIELSANNTTCK